MSRRNYLLALAAVILLALLSLGSWQTRRAEQKEELLIGYADARAAEPVVVTDLSRLERLERFTRVRLRGRFDARHVVLLENQVHEGRVGVHVLVPLETGPAEAVLVNLGWLPLDRQAGPPEPVVPDSPVEITGIVNSPPAVGMRLGEPGRGSWPLLTPYLDIGQLDEALAADLVNRVVLADPEPGTGYVRVWRVVSFPPSRHRAYAFQWYSLAAGFAVACAVVWWRYRGGVT